MRIRRFLLPSAFAAALLAVPLSSTFACEAHAKAAAAAPRGDKESQGEWVCEMGPECSGYQKGPGECPKCGMKLIHKSALRKK